MAWSPPTPADGDDGAMSNVDRWMQEKARSDFGTAAGAAFYSKQEKARIARLRAIKGSGLSSNKSSKPKPNPYGNPTRRRRPRPRQEGPAAAGYGHHNDGHGGGGGGGRLPMMDYHDNVSQDPQQRSDASTMSGERDLEPEMGMGGRLFNKGGVPKQRKPSLVGHPHGGHGGHGLSGSHGSSHNSQNGRTMPASHVSADPHGYASSGNIDGYGGSDHGVGMSYGGGVSGGGGGGMGLGMGYGGGAMGNGGIGHNASDLPGHLPMETSPVVGGGGGYGGAGGDDALDMFETAAVPTVEQVASAVVDAEAVDEAEFNELQQMYKEGFNAAEDLVQQIASGDEQPAQPNPQAERRRRRGNNNGGKPAGGGGGRANGKRRPRAVSQNDPPLDADSGGRQGEPALQRMYSPKGSARSSNNPLSNNSNSTNQASNANPDMDAGQEMRSESAPSKGGRASGLGGPKPQQKKRRKVPRQAVIAQQADESDSGSEPSRPARRRRQPRARAGSDAKDSYQSNQNQSRGSSQHDSPLHGGGGEVGGLSHAQSEGGLTAAGLRRRRQKEAAKSAAAGGGGGGGGGVRAPKPAASSRSPTEHPAVRNDDATLMRELRKYKDDNRKYQLEQQQQKDADARSVRSEGTGGSESARGKTRDQELAEQLMAEAQADIKAQAAQDKATERAKLRGKNARNKQGLYKTRAVNGE